MTRKRFKELSKLICEELNVHILKYIIGNYDKGELCINFYTPLSAIDSEVDPVILSPKDRMYLTFNGKEIKNNKIMAIILRYFSFDPDIYSKVNNEKNK